MTYFGIRGPWLVVVMMTLVIIVGSGATTVALALGSWLLLASALVNAVDHKYQGTLNRVDFDLMLLALLWYLAMNAYVLPGASYWPVLALLVFVMCYPQIAYIRSVPTTSKVLRLPFAEWPGKPKDYVDFDTLMQS